MGGVSAMGGVGAMGGLPALVDSGAGKLPLAPVNSALTEHYTAPDTQTMHRNERVV